DGPDGTSQPRAQDDPVLFQTVNGSGFELRRLQSFRSRFDRNALDDRAATSYRPADVAGLIESGRGAGNVRQFRQPRRDLFPSGDPLARLFLLNHYMRGRPEQVPLQRRTESGVNG